MTDEAQEFRSLPNMTKAQRAAWVEILLCAENGARLFPKAYLSAKSRRQITKLDELGLLKTHQAVVVVLGDYWHDFFTMSEFENEEGNGPGFLFGLPRPEKE